MRTLSLSWLLILPLVGTTFACGSDDDPPRAQTCDPDAQEDTCEGSTQCFAQEDGSGLCQLPAGSACDPEAEESLCRVGSACSPAKDAWEGAPDHACRVEEGAECDPLAEDYCVDGYVCEDMSDGGAQCHLPVLVRGHVMDAGDGSALVDAHVMALDPQQVAITDIAVSEAEGIYELVVPVTRNADGSPADESFTLRAAAQGYQSFPEGLRVALPIHGGDASETEEGWVIASALSEVTLIALPDAANAPHTVRGELVLSGDDQREAAGVLVVAEGDAVRSTITDRSGHFTLFNMPDGDFQVTGYASGVDVATADLSVMADVEDFVLEGELATLSTVSGTVQIVDSGDAKMTSVILVVESTFDEAFVRGATPRGLRAPESGAPSITGAFSIAGVPDGDYVVLAGFENDNIVRDPDTNIAGTEIVHITVSGSDVVVQDSFKLTGALELFGPGAEMPEEVMSAPTLRWDTDSSAAWYEVRVFDVFGNEVWNDLNVVPETSGEVSVLYGGPLDPGMYYQFRVTSWRQPSSKEASAISATEDLRGIFYTTASLE